MPQTIFGKRDKIVVDHTEAWCIAKLIRLVGPLGPPVDGKYDEEFAVARHLAVTDNPHTGDVLIPVRSWRRKLEEPSDQVVPPELLDFIEYLLVIDHNKRPTASEERLHPYLAST